ncbi:MAG TPA: ABC transporter permease [Candidatus Binatia bacterium]
MPSASDTETPIVRIEPSRGWISLNLRALWEYRELLYFLIWREVKIRYKQTVIGLAWVILQPLITILIFTVVFSHFAGIPSDGIPYPIFAYTGLLPWSYFASAVGRAGNSLLGDAQLLEKVYFPRPIIPISSVVSPLVDFIFGFLVLLGMVMLYGYAPSIGVAALPLFMLFAAVTALAVGLWFAPLNVRYRDVGHIIPFIIQIWMYASPIIYPVSAVPEKWKLLYSLNPMVGVIEGFRWALLSQSAPDYPAMAVGALVVVGLLFGGMVYFSRMERTFADVI